MLYPIVAEYLKEEAPFNSQANFKECSLKNPISNRGDRY